MTSVQLRRVPEWLLVLLRSSDRWREDPPSRPEPCDTEICVLEEDDAPPDPDADATQLISHRTACLGKMASALRRADKARVLRVTSVVRRGGEEVPFSASYASTAPPPPPAETSEAAEREDGADTSGGGEEAAPPPDLETDDGAAPAAAEEQEPQAAAEPPANGARAAPTAPDDADPGSEELTERGAPSPPDADASVPPSPDAADVSFRREAEADPRSQEEEEERTVFRASDGSAVLSLLGVLPPECLHAIAGARCAWPTDRPGHVAHLSLQKRDVLLMGRYVVLEQSYERGSYAVRLSKRFAPAPRTKGAVLALARERARSAERR